MLVRGQLKANDAPILYIAPADNLCLCVAAHDRQALCVNPEALGESNLNHCRHRIVYRTDNGGND